MYYQVGQSVEIVCIDSWSEYNGDYQILGYTTMDNMKLMNIDIYSKFKNKEQSDLYEQFYAENRLFYILKSIKRLNFDFIDEDNNTDKVDEYIYLCDDLIDFNKTEVLTKRCLLNTNIFVGTFFTEKLLDTELEITGYHKDIIDNLREDIINLLSNYSDSFTIEFDDSNTILQKLSIALADDSSFLEKRNKAKEEAIKLANEEEEKKNYLIKKENFLLEKERELNLLKADAIKQQKDLEIKLKEIDDEKSSLRASQNAIDKYEAYLTQKEAKLNNRADRITARENELGISNSNL